MNERKKKGLISLLVAVICFGIGVFVVGGAIGGILLLGAIVALNFILFAKLSDYFKNRK